MEATFNKAYGAFSSMESQVLLWYLLLADAMFANITAWFYPTWYARKYKGLAKIFPLAKGWTAMYLLLLIWIGFLLSKLGMPIIFLR